MPNEDKKNINPEKSEQTDYDKELRMESVLLDEDVAQGYRPITEDEARIILENPKILEVLIEEIGKNIVGETETIKTILLSAFGSLVKNNEIASYNLLVNSEAGSGKDYVVHSTLKILPKDRWIKKTRISPNVFTYWHNPKFEPEWTWDGKILYLEDISDNVMNSDVFKVMCSSGSNATILIKQMPVDIEIKGKPVMILTSANAMPSPEITRRFTIVNLDESIEQTEAIMRRKADCEAKGKRIEYDKNIIKALETLERIDVKIPYADLLPDFMPKKSIIMRTHFARFLDYIKSSCALHQFQRERDNGSFIANGQDYDIARDVLLKLTSNPFMIPLTHNDKKVLEIFEKQTESMNAEELFAKVEVSKSQMYLIVNKLTRYGFLHKDIREYEDTRKNCTIWSLENSIKVSPLNIPTWSEVSKKMQVDKND